MVVINLEDKDDAQEIFETLNAMGTPLLPADLVKNFLFHEAIERGLYTGLTERVEFERSLTLEHLMPQHWEAYWPLPCPPDDRIAVEQAARARRNALHKIGKLTLLTKKLNPSVSNGPWIDKRNAILDHAALNLSRPLRHAESWDEQTIHARSESLFAVALRIWPRPQN